MRVYHTFYIEYKDAEYEVDGSANVYRELYGSDADGNRGVMMDFVEDIQVENLGDEAKKLPIADQQQIEALAEKKMDDHDWHEDVLEPEEPDYED